MSSHFSIKSTARSFAGVAFSATLSLSYLGSAAQNAPIAAVASGSIQNSVQTLIADHRKILSLQGYSTSPTTTTQQHQEAIRVGEYLFVEDQHISAGILERLLAHGAQADIDDFLTTLNDPAVKDADLFSVRSILTEVAKKASLNPTEAKQIRNLLKNLAVAHNKYGQELNTALSQKVIAQTKPERPAWAAYIAEVEQQFPATSLLEALKGALPTAEQQATPSDKSADFVAQTRANEWQGLQLEKGSVLLTFDDGPHPIYTKEILSILARYKVKAIFFQLGQNLGTVTAGHAELTRNEDIEKEILSEGHAIGNHSFTHPFLPKLDQMQVQQEIDKTQALLDLVITDDTHRTHMFRAPYGARNSMILGEIGERGLRSVLWNVDSLDWSDPVPESIVHRILQELEHAGRGIILMHDIHPKTVIALPMLLDELIKRGYHFVQWDGGNLVATVRDTTDAAPINLPAPAAP
jgi:peptidoglycan/xylan/chitin deacetylase (PgdA/CDA1 family)